MRREQVPWGWGEPGAGPSLPAHALPWLRELGVSGDVVAPPPPSVALPPAAAVPERLAEICEVRTDDGARLLRAAGKSYLDLLAVRSGALDEAPDAVVAPGSPAEVLAVLQTCAEHAVAVVPFGGGTSVVGGVAPVRGRCEAVVTLDLGRLDAVLAVDERTLSARLQPGLRLPEADHALGERGLTLGHLPQSYDWATVGGCVATRSAGQASTGFGRIDDNVLAVRLAAPVGELSTLPVPASAAGPALRELLVGSEGAFGVLTEVTLRVRPMAAATRYEGFFVRSFGEGCEVLRTLEQEGAAPDVVRLSDEPETAMSLAMAGREGVRAALGAAVLRARGFAEGCLLICGWEGASEDEVRARRTASWRRLKAVGALAAGHAVGEAWRASRFAGPHLRDDLMDRGVLVETVETATTWDRLTRLHAAVRAALVPLGGRVTCHVSHLYPTGASLYFTVLAAADREDPAGQWRAAKAAVTDAIAAAGGTITHHHAVGRDHRPWLEAEDGRLGVDLLRSVKTRLDPAGIMNPGKLL